MRLIRWVVLLLAFWGALAPLHLRAEEEDQAYVRLAIEMALSAVEKGDQPFGAVLVKDGQVIMRAGNTVKTDDNITHHAETNMLAAAFRKLSPDTIKGCTLYASCEPCAMCCGAIYIAVVTRLVYGLSAARLSAMTGFKEAFPTRAFFRVAGSGVAVRGPMLEEDAAKVIKKYLDRQKKP